MTHQPSPPLLHGRYLLREQLGVGGMGAVYLAEDQNLAGKLVAIKQNTETSAAVQHQFNREAVLLANLKHPALPAVTDYFIEPDGSQFLVMEYIEGKDLWETLQANGGPLPEATVLGWIASVMDALEYLHRYIDPATKQPRPIIHRDVKPANIKLKTDGQIYLVDFGLAKIEESGMTQPGARAYTAGYSPFEQYGGGTSTRSDIYALGATLYTLLTGDAPPEAPLLISGDALTAPRQRNPHITPNTEQGILRAMALRPEDRFQTIAEMRSALFRKPAPPAPPTQRLPAKRRLSGALTVLLIGLVVAGLALAAYTTDSELERSAVRLFADLFAPTRIPTPSPPTTTPLPVAVAPSATPTRPPVPTATTSVTPTLSPTPTLLPTLSPTVAATATIPLATAAPCPTGMALVAGDTGAFCLATHEVTNAEYRACESLGICLMSQTQKTGMPSYSGSATYYDDAQYATYPVVNMTITQAQRYCGIYGGYQGQPLRLPTFDEWMAAYQAVGNTPAPADRLLPSADLQLGTTNDGIQGLLDNVKEWVVVELTATRAIELVFAAGGSFDVPQFPTNHNELSNYPRILAKEIDEKREFNIGFRCAVDAASEN